MNKNWNSVVLTVAAFGLWVVIGGTCSVAKVSANESDAVKELQELKKLFGPVLKLKSKPIIRREINAIANLIDAPSKLKAIDATKASGEMCMLEVVSKHNMIHFSETPEKTEEDIIYYINPATFIANGLDVSKLPRHPHELGKMTPLQWYYYDGTYVEPHQGSKLGKEFVIMSINVK